MKIQYKAAALITVFGVVIVILLSAGYNLYSHNTLIDSELKNIKNISEEVSLHLDSHLTEKADTTVTLSSVPLIKDTLLKSNFTFAKLPTEKRKQAIDNLNKQWKEIEDINDPFIQNHMTNPVAEFLKQQQILFPGVYGEIFLTNRYGVMIATTGKLTTLAHAHKYWWVASYNNGKGKIFLDDRGFDASVDGYVLGIVVPVREDNEIIGILKCNVNIMGPLTDIVEEFSQRHIGQLKIVRTGGLVVSEHGATPLSTQVKKEISGLLLKRDTGTTIIYEDKENQLVAYTPVSSTMGTEKFSFGGKQKSLGHIKGNKGEGWHVVLSLDQEVAAKIAHEATKVIIFYGLFFIVVSAAAAFLLGKKISKPIVGLANTAQIIGQGNLDAQYEIHSNDEIGILANSLNNMATNLKQTMTTRDKLVDEIELRRQEEAKKEALIIKLQKALDEVKTLRGIIPICSKCHKIRDDKGFWQQVDQYITEHSDAVFSHGMCLQCSDELYGGQDWYDEGKKKGEIRE
jgi:HAMP domain-containing protein